MPLELIPKRPARLLAQHEQTPGAGRYLKRESSTRRPASAGSRGDEPADGAPHTAGAGSVDGEGTGSNDRPVPGGGGPLRRESVEEAVPACRQLKRRVLGGAAAELALEVAVAPQERPVGYAARAAAIRDQWAKGEAWAVALRDQRAEAVAFRAQRAQRAEAWAVAAEERAAAAEKTFWASHRRIEAAAAASWRPQLGPEVAASRPEPLAVPSAGEDGRQPEAASRPQPLGVPSSAEGGRQPAGGSGSGAVKAHQRQGRPPAAWRPKRPGDKRDSGAQFHAARRPRKPGGQRGHRQRLPLAVARGGRHGSGFSVVAARSQAGLAAVGCKAGRRMRSCGGLELGKLPLCVVRAKAALSASAATWRASRPRRQGGRRSPPGRRASGPLWRASGPGGGRVAWRGAGGRGQGRERQHRAELQGCVWRRPQGPELSGQGRRRLRGGHARARRDRCARRYDTGVRPALRDWGSPGGTGADGAAAGALAAPDAVPLRRRACRGGVPPLRRCAGGGKRRGGREALGRSADGAGTVRGSLAVEAPGRGDGHPPRSQGEAEGERRGGALLAPQPAAPAGAASAPTLGGVVATRTLGGGAVGGRGGDVNDTGTRPAGAGWMPTPPTRVQLNAAGPAWASTAAQSPRARSAEPLPAGAARAPTTPARGRPRDGAAAGGRGGPAPACGRLCASGTRPAGLRPAGRRPAGTKPAPPQRPARPLPGIEAAAVAQARASLGGEPGAGAAKSSRGEKPSVAAQVARATTARSPRASGARLGLRCRGGTRGWRRPPFSSEQGGGGERAARRRALSAAAGGLGKGAPGAFARRRRGHARAQRGLGRRARRGRLRRRRAVGSTRRGRPGPARLGGAHARGGAAVGGRGAGAFGAGARPAQSGGSGRGLHEEPTHTLGGSRPSGAARRLRRAVASARMGLARRDHGRRDCGRRHARARRSRWRRARRGRLGLRRAVGSARLGLAPRDDGRRDCGRRGLGRRARRGLARGGASAGGLGGAGAAN